MEKTEIEQKLFDIAQDYEGGKLSLNEIRECAEIISATLFHYSNIQSVRTFMFRHNDCVYKFTF